MTSLLIAAALPVLCAAGLYGCAWYYRWRAGQLLAILQQVRPGVTTEVEYLKLMRPVASHLQPVMGDGEKPITGAYGTSNEPRWLGRIGNLFYEGLPMGLGRFGCLNGPFFWVIPEFKDRTLTSINIASMQGNGHPAGASVTEYGGQIGSIPWLPEPMFKGYSVHQRIIGDAGTVWHSSVALDDRATAEQRRRALDFRFECFTDILVCEDGSKFLQPAPER